MRFIPGKATRRTAWAALALLVSALPAVCASAAGGYAGDEVKKAEPRREPTFWIRPARTSAVEQLAWARALDADGRRRAAGHAYRALVYAWPDAPEAPVAQLDYARNLAQRGWYRDAFLEYQYLIDYYAGTFPFDDLMARELALADQVRAARRYRWLFGGFYAPERAVPLYEKIVADAPDWTNAPYAEFQCGLIHEHGDEWDDAITAYDTVQSRYYASSEAPEAAFRRAHCLAALSDDQPRNASSCELARLSLQQFLRDQPASPSAADARCDLTRMDRRLGAMAYAIAHYYDRIAKRPAAGIQYYQDFLRRFPDDPNVPAARARLAALQEK